MVPYNLLDQIESGLMGCLYVRLFTLSNKYSINLDPVLVNLGCFNTILLMRDLENKHLFLIVVKAQEVLKSR